MFDLGWMEMAIIGVIALMIVGPKDMPKVIRAVTEGLGRLKALSRDFRSGLDDLARDANLDKLQEDIEKVANSASADVNSIGGMAGDMAGDFDYAGLEDDPETNGGYASYWSPTRTWNRVTPGEGATNWPKHRKVAGKERPKYSNRRIRRDIPVKRKVRT